MADFNLIQIENKLEEFFQGDNRTLIFWYDEKQEFIEEINEIKLKRASLYILEKDESFKAKLFFEREDQENNYLVYAPFEKPISRENHLTDTIKYSKEFYADRASLIAYDFVMSRDSRNIIERHIDFFGAKTRTSSFYMLEGELKSPEEVEVALLSACLKHKTINFDEVVREVLTSGDLVDNQKILEFAKYGLDRVFWNHIEDTFAYSDEEPSVEKFLISLFLTYLSAASRVKLDESNDKFILAKPGTVITFMDQLMNSVVYAKEFDKLSQQIFATTKGESIVNNIPIENLIDLDIFSYIDEKIIAWMVEKLVDENINSTINGMDIQEICEHRERLHFGKQFDADYHLLKHAYSLIKESNYQVVGNSVEIVDRYVQRDYKLDWAYRKFIYHIDRATKPVSYDVLVELIENIYNFKFLGPVNQKFNEDLSIDLLNEQYSQQRDFYKKNVSGTRENLVVIISDGMRYEVAQELVEKMSREKKYETINISPMLATVPTYTSVGMAALLPHKKLEITDDFKVMVDGKPSSNLVQRTKILLDVNSDATAINYVDLVKYKRDQLREFFLNKKLVYIYHDQIDNRGENAEDEAFQACHEAIDEIMDLMVRLTDNVSRTRFVITADHGFIYRRKQLVESDKIDSFYSKDDQRNKRFIISNESYEEKGTRNFLVSDLLGDFDDERTVTVPIGMNIFKMPGGGQNYVHGGTSLQELIVPVIEVKTIKGAKEERTVEIAMISMLSKVTGLIVNLDFIQKEPISDVIVPTDYKISFVDVNGEHISNEEIYRADSKAKESAYRIFRLQFNLKNKKYSRFDKYYLIAVDNKTGVEIFRNELIIDIAFADDFDFGI